MFISSYILHDINHVNIDNESDDLLNELRNVNITSDIDSTISVKSIDTGLIMKYN